MKWEILFLTNKLHIFSIAIPIYFSNILSNYNIFTNSYHHNQFYLDIYFINAEKIFLKKYINKNCN